MYDASVGLMTKVGIPIRRLLVYLQDYLYQSKMLPQAAFKLTHIQREDGINPEVAYTLDIEVTAPVYVDAVDPSFDVVLATPAKGLFIGNTIVFDAGTTMLAVDTVTLAPAGDKLTVATIGTAVAGTIGIGVAANSVLNNLITAEANYEIIVDPGP